MTLYEILIYDEGGRHSRKYHIEKANGSEAIIAALTKLKSEKDSGVILNYNYNVRCTPIVESKEIIK